MGPTWTTGNQFRLLENGEEYFPRVLAAIEGAQQSVLLETFILFDDEVGQPLRDALIAAARRGISVALTVDGFGSADLSPAFLGGLVEAGVVVHLFSPRRRLVGMRTNLFRRLHRKLVAVDASVAFVGGINVSVQHLIDSGPLAKQDYAVEVQGPAAREIHEFLLDAIHASSPGPKAPPRRPVRRVSEAGAPAGPGTALLVTRDNDRHRRDIERQYLLAIRGAERELIIANAYFLPGYRLLQAICDAARRGVDVQLIVQGNPDMMWVKRTVDMLYAHLREAGVRIFEYCERPLHGKVAVVDDDWATVGSSNLDPLSLFLNLEANLIIRDADFAAALKQNLRTRMESSCQEVPATPDRIRPRWQGLATALVFHALRRFPAWAGWLPAHTPKLLTPTLDAPPSGWQAGVPTPPREQDCP